MPSGVRGVGESLPYSIVALRFIFAAELQRGRAGIRSGWD